MLCCVVCNEVGALVWYIEFVRSLWFVLIGCADLCAAVRQCHFRTNACITCFLVTFLTKHSIYERYELHVTRRATMLNECLKRALQLRTIGKCRQVAATTAAAVAASKSRSLAVREAQRPISR